MAITVYTVTPHHAGFGMYQRSPEGETFDSFEDYLDACGAAGCELVEDDDPDYEHVRDAEGATYNQDGGKIVAFRNQSGHVALECVIED